jgi:multidrug resistance efflux pump
MGEYRTTKGEPALASAALRRRRQLRRLGLFALLIAALGALGTVTRLERSFLATGYVTTETYAEVRPATVGTIAAILVQTGSAVTQGQVLVRLDMAEDQASVEEAQNLVLQLESDLGRRQAEIAEEKRQHLEQIAIARLRLQNAEAKLTRAQELLAKGLLAGSTMEDYTLASQLAAAELDSLLKKDQSIPDQELATRQRAINVRREALARAAARLNLKLVRAPVAGQVLRYEFVLGELVRPENILYEVFGGDRQVLKLRIPERYAERVSEGQRYKALLTSYGGLQPVWFTGHIEHLRNVIQAEGQKTYRVAYGDFDAGGRAVSPGTSAEARIYYGKVSLWQFLLDL